MQINISILKVDKISKTTAKGNGYSQLDVAYKDLGSGKVESRKVMSFGDTASTHKVLSEAKTGDTFEIVSEKKPGSDGKEYWTWLSAKQHAPGTEVPGATPVGNPVLAAQRAGPQGSSYPSAEERSATQRSIVRQSSLKAAIDSFSSSKTPPDVDTLLARAQIFVDFVNEKLPSKQLEVFDAPKSKTGFHDMDDDIPF